MAVTDPLLTPLIDLVREHYATSDDPFYLSRLGQALGAKRSALIAQHGRLVDAVLAAGLDVVGRDLPGRATVVTPEVREAVSRKLTRGGSAGGAAFDNLPMPLQIAFCLRVE